MRNVEDMASHETPRHIKLDEHKHVETPLLDQFTAKVHVTPLLTEPQEAGA